MPRSKRKRRRSRASTNVRIERVAAPRTRLRSLFALLHDVITSADRALLYTENVDQHLVRFDVAMVQRGINTLKAVRLLTENGHWEFAAGATRQLYELVVNMEYLAAQPDRDAAAFRYAKFGLLQAARAAHRELLYNQKTSRPVDQQRLAALESLLEHSFPEFRLLRPNGDVKWTPSWSGKSTRELAALSSHRLRLDQYEQLFSTWSEQTHAAPGALIDSFAQQAGDNWPADVIARDDVLIAEIVTIAVSLFLELWHLLPTGPRIDVAQFTSWTAALITEARKHGARAAPPARPSTSDY